MIIEAAPRLQDGPLEGNTPLLKISKNESNQLCHQLISKSPQRKFFTKTRFGSFTKGRLSLGEPDSRHSPSSHFRRCKTSYRWCPYDQESREKTGSYKWNFLFASLPIRKCPLSLRGSVCEKAFDLHSLLKKSPSTVKKGVHSRTGPYTPIFTANVNENNDNCPNAAYRTGGFEVSPQRLTETTLPGDTDQICDVEIEDLTTGSSSDFFENFSAEKSNSWRQRRKSFNTNPLSSTTERKSLDKPPSLLSVEDLLLSTPTNNFRSSEQVEEKIRYQDEEALRRTTNIYQILGIEPSGVEPRPLSSTRASSLVRSQGRSHFCSKDRVEEENKSDSIAAPNSAKDNSYLPYSIERLVEFFEANSSNKFGSKATRNQAPSSHGKSPEHFFQGNLSKNRIKKDSFARISAANRNGDTAPPNRRRPSTSPNIAYQRSSPVNFSSLFHTGPWDSVIRSSPGFIQANSSLHSRNKPQPIPGGVYNNNANAASATAETKLSWPEAPVSCRQNPHKSPFPTHSSSSFSHTDRESSSSSLSPVSTDVELIDLESTRLSSWPGTRSIPEAFERHQYQPSKCQTANQSLVDDLIDLQTTSKRSGSRGSNWLTSANSSFSAKESRQQPLALSRYSQNFQRVTKAKSSGDRPEDRYQEGFSSIRTHDSKASVVNRASANNHHNEPGICEYYRYQETGSERFESQHSEKREKQFPFGNFNFHHSLLNPLLRKKSNFFRSDSCEMGCIQSIAKAKVSPDRCSHGVIVEDIQAAIDRTPTEIEEKSPIVLRYRTPYFRASAHVIVPPIPRKETWTVGWIQACDSMKFINQYGDLGNSSWEIPALKDRRIAAVSDSDGVSYPWYGNTTEIATVEGPTDTSRSLTLRMNDNFYPSVTWDIPVSEGSEAHLTHIVRDQSFTTWLAAVNQTTGRLEVLRTVKWHFYLEIDVDPTQELGKRACIISPLEQKQPVILKNNLEPIYISSPRRGNNTVPAGGGGRQKRVNRRPGAGGDNNSNNHTNYIPKSALVRPSANNAQTLIWRPTRDVPVIVVPAKEEYKENNEVVWFTRTPTMHGHDHNVRVLSIQEMTQLKKTIS